MGKTNALDKASGEDNTPGDTAGDHEHSWPYISHVVIVDHTNWGLGSARGSGGVRIRHFCASLEEAHALVDRDHRRTMNEASQSSGLLRAEHSWDSTPGGPQTTTIYRSRYKGPNHTDLTLRASIYEKEETLVYTILKVSRMAAADFDRRREH